MNHGAAHESLTPSRAGARGAGCASRWRQETGDRRKAKTKFCTHLQSVTHEPADVWPLRGGGQR